MAHPEPSRVFGVCLALTRALENRGPEEFTLRTASGGENNPKVKKKAKEANRVDMISPRSPPVIHCQRVLGRVLQLLGIWLVNGWLANKGGRSSASRVYVHQAFV